MSTIRALCLAVLALLPMAAAAAEPMNVLLLMAEDLSPRLGSYGDEVARTPHLDRLAREGVRFERAFTTAGVCAPSRAGIIMGVHQNAWGAGHMRASAGGYVAVPPPGMKAFPEILRAAGVYTVNNGKTDYQMSTRFGGAWGGPFSIWDEESGEDWRGRAEGQPFFAYLTFGITHESQGWPLLSWPLSLIELLFLPSRIWSRSGWIDETDPARVSVPPYYPDTPTVRADIARHYNNVQAMDAQVGEVLAKLEEDGLTDETVVIFTTDHGDGLPRAKRWPYDSGIHVPLIVRWPGVTEPGTTNEELVSGVDFAPTILRAAGHAVPEHMQGRVFVGPDRGPEPPYVYAARDRIDEQPDRVRAIRDRRYKLVRHLIPDQPYVLPIAFRNNMPMMAEMLALHDAGELEGTPARWFRAARDAEELFDLEADPHEIRNLADDPAHAERRATLARELDAWLAASGDLGLLPEEELRERFWPGGEQPVTAPPTATRAAGRIALRCATEGASIGVRIGDDAWRLYTGPFDDPGRPVVAKAVRYGFAESDEVAVP